MAVAVVQETAVPAAGRPAGPRRRRPGASQPGPGTGTAIPIPPRSRCSEIGCNTGAAHLSGVCFAPAEEGDPVDTVTARKRLEEMCGEIDNSIMVLRREQPAGRVSSDSPQDPADAGATLSEA